MIYESRFENLTEGLMCGAAILHTPLPSIEKLKIGRKRPEISCVEVTKWAPYVIGQKIIVRDKASKTIIWMRAYETKGEAAFVYAKICGIDLYDHIGRSFTLPGITDLDLDTEVVYASTQTYNSSANDSANDWNTAGGTKCPAGVTSADNLLIGGGGSGGAGASNGSGCGGGGAGGFKKSLGTSVTPGTNYPAVVGTGGAQVAAGNTTGNNGVDTTWNSLQANKGGGGGGSNVAPPTGTFGSGGGGDYAHNGTAGTAGQGNNGGNGQNSPAYDGGGGGGAGAAGSNGSGTVGGNGGNGSLDSITGGAVTYAGGGGGGADGQNFGGTAGGTGGTGGGGNGGLKSSTVPTAGTPNLGGGGGGSGNNSIGAAGGAGVVILSFVQQFVHISVPFSQPNFNTIQVSY